MMFPSPRSSRPTITIGSPEVTVVGDRARWSIPIDAPAMPDCLWYEVPSAYADMLTDRADPALLALTLPAMARQTPMVIEAPVTDELAFSHPDMQALYAATGRGLPQPLIARERLPATTRTAGVATGFSAGIDSFAVLAEHHYARNIPNSLRLTHLLFNNVGSHGWGDRADDLGRARLQRLGSAVEQIGLPLIDVTSNVDAFHAPPLWFYLTHTPRNASVAHLLSKGLGTWLYASTLQYRDIRVTADAQDTALVDPIALPLMSTSAITLRDSGTRQLRVQKTAIVADLPLSWEYLDVCSNIDTPGAAQCSDCMKCRRTLMTLDVLGVIDRYDRIFDLAHWADIRDEYLWDVMTARSRPLRSEIRELIRARGYKVPARIAWYAVPQAWKSVTRGGERVATKARRGARKLVGGHGH